MTKTIKLALVAALALGATSAFATNGTSLIGFGAKSRAMGGTGISNFGGAESAFTNPALIGRSAKSTEVTIGATILMPTVSFEADQQANQALTFIPPSGPSAINTAGTNDSTAGDGMIPAVAVINKVNDSFAWGLALYGVAGMGVDYRTENTATAASSTPAEMGGINNSLLLMRMSIPLAYSVSGFSAAIAPVIEYGSLAMGSYSPTGNPASGDSQSGVTTDIAMGFEVGLAYEISGISLGLDYKSAVTHDFKGTFLSYSSTGTKNTELDTPSVLGLGVSYNMGEHTIALDYKIIGNSSAKGLEDFGWEDQNVIALGYEYQAKGWAARVGYNYGSSPLPTDITATPTPAGPSNGTFNQVAGSMMQFPAVTESHYTIGGTYSFTDAMSLDAALVVATGSAEATIPAAFTGSTDGTITTTNDQVALSVALDYAF